MEVVMGEVLECGVRLAGVDLGCLVLANLLVPGILEYRENVGRMDVAVRNVFWSHKLHTVLLLGGMMVMCFSFAEELVLGGGLAGGVCWFMAVFWSVKVGMHFFYFDRELKRGRPVYNLVFLAAFVYLAGVFWVLVLRSSLGVLVPNGRLIL